MTCSQQEGGQTMPLESMASRQHWPLVAIQRGAEHSFMAISPIPPTAARPRPPRIGAKPAAPTPAAPSPAAPTAPAAPPSPTVWATTELAASRAKPPKQTVTIISLLRVFLSNESRDDCQVSRPATTGKFTRNIDKSW